MASDHQTCSDGFAASRASITLMSLRMLGVEVSQTTASIFLAVDAVDDRLHRISSGGGVDEVDVVPILDRHTRCVCQPLWDSTVCRSW